MTMETETITRAATTRGMIQVRYREPHNSAAGDVAGGAGVTVVVAMVTRG